MDDVPSVVEFESQFDSHLDGQPAIINSALDVNRSIISAQSHVDISSSQAQARPARASYIGEAGV